MSWHKFWLWYYAIFAVLNTVMAMLVPETLVMYVDAWCAVVLVVCATTEWYCVDNGSWADNSYATIDVMTAATDHNKDIDVILRAARGEGGAE